jgi:hypothetical protein
MSIEDQTHPAHIEDVALDYSERPRINVEYAKAKSILNDINLRTKMTEGLLHLFIKVNAYVLLVVGLAVAIDTWLIAEGLIKAEQRLVNAEVVMTLIGAATVQLGSVIFTISAYLFPKA